MTHHNRPCMALKIIVLTTKGLVCHSEYQYSQLKTLYVTQRTSTHHYGPCMSLRVSVIITVGLVCHSGHQYLPLHVLYAIPLSDWYVNHSTSTSLYQPGMSIREQRRTVLNMGRGGGLDGIGWGGGMGGVQTLVNLGLLRVPPCISKLLGGRALLPPGPLAPCSYANVFSFANLVCDTGYH